MTKRILCLALAALLAVSLCACRNKPIEDETDPTTTTLAPATTTSTSVTTTIPTTTTTAPTIAQPVTYVSSNNPGLTLTLPASWNGKYAVRDDVGSVIFYELSNHMSDGSGKLFTIKFMEAAAYDDGMFPSYTFIGEYGENVLVVLYPTDVQFAPDKTDAYNAMAADVASVVATITYNP